MDVVAAPPLPTSTPFTDTRYAFTSLAIGVTVTDGGVQPCGIVTFMTEQLEPDPIASALKDFRINVSVSEESGNLVSYEQRNIPGVVRASLHYYNTDAEIDYFIDCLKQILSR